MARVLIAHPDKITAEHYMTFIRIYGRHCSSYAANAQSTFSELEHNTYDIVLFDSHFIVEPHFGINCKKRFPGVHIIELTHVVPKNCDPFPEISIFIARSSGHHGVVEAVNTCEIMLKYPGMSRIAAHGLYKHQLWELGRTTHNP